MRSLLLGLVLLAPLAVAQEPVAVHMLHMQDFEYLPLVTRVPPGVTVYAMNFGAENHTVTSARGLFDVRDVPPGGEPRTFVAPTALGDHTIYCAYHGDARGNGMVGVLRVEDPPPSTPSSGSAAGAAPKAETPLHWVLALAAIALLALARRR